MTDRIDVLCELRGVDVEVSAKVHGADVLLVRVDGDAEMTAEERREIEDAVWDRWAGRWW